MPEVLVSAVLMLMVLGMVFSLWIQANRGISKGEDSLQTIRDTSMVVRQFRRDLQRFLVPAASKPWHLRYLKIQGRSLIRNQLLWDASQRGFQNDYVATDNAAQVYPEDQTEFSFYATDQKSGDPEKITYTYFPARLVLRRQAGFASPKNFALPRLQDFVIQMHTADFQGLSHPVFETEAFISPVLQLWFQIHFRVQALEKASDIRKTQVEMNTQIFPRHFHQELQSRWSGRP